MSYHEIFWARVEEVCAISKPLVKVLHLVDGDKLAMGYLYKAMDKAKQVIHWYHEDKREDGFIK